LKTGKLKIEGAFCGACTYAIEKAARRIKEIEEIRVNTGTKIITVSYEGDSSILKKVEAIVETLGHTAKVIDEGEN
jgi:copper chaperone CopZ